MIEVVDELTQPLWFDPGSGGQFVLEISHCILR